MRPQIGLPGGADGPTSMAALSGLTMFKKEHVGLGKKKRWENMREIGGEEMKVEWSETHCIHV